MSTGFRRLEKKIFDADPMTSTVRSSVVDIRGVKHVGISLIFTGTPTGTFTIEGSNDYAENGANATWRAITTSPSTISASGSASDHLLSLNHLPFDALSVLYTRSSGSGTLNAYLKAKE